MPPAPLSPGACSRRAFLGGALGAAGGLVLAGSLADVAWAGDSTTPDPKTFFPLVLSSDLAASPQPQRLVFALSHSTAKGIKYASGPRVTVRFRKKGGQWSQRAEARVRPRRTAEGTRGLRRPPAVRQRRHLAGRGDALRDRRCRSRSR